MLLQEPLQHSVDMSNSRRVVAHVPQQGNLEGGHGHARLYLHHNTQNAHNQSTVHMYSTSGSRAQRRCNWRSHSDGEPRNTANAPSSSIWREWANFTIFLVMSRVGRSSQKCSRQQHRAWLKSYKQATHLIGMRRLRSSRELVDEISPTGQGFDRQLQTETHTHTHNHLVAAHLKQGN